MAELYDILHNASTKVSKYHLKKNNRSYQEAKQLLDQSKLFYVGNLSFYTTEEQVYELFSRAGEVHRVIMGLDKIKRTPCGFCFVEYEDRASAERCKKYIDKTRLDDRIIRIDWDIDYDESRRYGRGTSGGQVRDEFRTDYDPGRGGYGLSNVLNAETGKKRPLEDGGDAPEVKKALLENE